MDCSSARARSADGGPPCWSSGLHGPHVSSVARNRSGPSGTKKASGALMGPSLRAVAIGVARVRDRRSPAERRERFVRESGLTEQRNDLGALGWDAARQTSFAPFEASGLVPARVIAQHRGRWTVSDGV